MIVQEPLQAAIWHCLNSYDYTDAVFLAERLVAEVSSNESVYLLASAYHRSGETAHANHILRTHGPRTPKLRYLHAVTAHSLNRYPEAESVLVAGLCSSSHNSASVAMQLSTATPNAKMMNLLHDTALTGYGVHACFALRLLGELYQKTQRPVRACVAYRAALAINPFLFTVFQRLLDAWPGDKLVDKSTTAPNNNSNNNNNNSINNNSPSSNNNNNTTTSTCGNNTHAYDTDPDDIFTLDKLSDLNCCHGNTLCTVVNSNDTYVNPSTVPGTAHGTGKTSTFITPASTGGATPLSVLSVCGNRSNVQQVGTPLGNIMLSCSQLYTPVGGTPASMAAPLLPPPLHQAPRKKAPPTQLPSLRTKQATAAASAMLSLNAPSLHAPLTPNFGVIPLDMTPLTPTSPNPESVDWPPMDGGLSFTSSVLDDSSSLAVLSPLVYPSPLSSQPPPTGGPKPPFSLARRVLCRSSSGNTAVGGVVPQSPPVLPPSSPPGSPGDPHGPPTSGGGGGSNSGGSHYHHSPASSHTSVRRSSRLFGSGSSVKENNKARVFVAPKSPVRRTKPRSLRPSTSTSTPSTSTSTSSAASPTAPSSSTTTSTSSSTNSLLELNNARNTTTPASNTSPGGENIMPGDTSNTSNILMPSTGVNTNTSKPASHNTSLILASTGDTKPATPLPPPPSTTTTTSTPNTPVMVLSQQELSKQAFLLQKQAAEGLMLLLRALGRACRLLSKYNLSASIEAFQSLPSHHFHSHFCLTSVAKAYFHSNDFQASVRYFRQAHTQHPHLLQDMDFYSTALWHLQKEVELSGLAQALLGVNKGRAVSWCAVGNCLSLQKEHEAAIKFFSRAVQVEPECWYAYTLLGHEHIATEELERALGCYRTAVRLNPHHYNAWYGIGLVLYKQEKYQHAEVNFRKALLIHPNSCVLLCHIAVVQHALDRSSAALQTLSRALALEPHNAMCRYHRAAIYLELGQPHTALVDLKVLQPLVPKEANVYLLVGKAYSKLGDPHLAQMNFSWALDLDPKGAAAAAGGGGAPGGPGKEGAMGAALLSDTAINAAQEDSSLASLEDTTEETGGVAAPPLDDSQLDPHNPLRGAGAGGSSDTEDHQDLVL